MTDAVAESVHDGPVADLSDIYYNYYWLLQAFDHNM